ncbi:unnamed protein product, partial [Effrenium voratum]
SGCISYVTLLRAKGQPQEWEMHPDYYEDWSSKDYRDVKGLASPSRSGMRLRHGKTMPALPKACRNVSKVRIFWGDGFNMEEKGISHLEGSPL